MVKINELEISVCGFCCSKCPKYLKKHCSGCRENDVCKIPECAKKKKVNLCFECKEFPCKLSYKFFQKSWLDFLKSDKIVG